MIKNNKLKISEYTNIRYITGVLLLSLMSFFPYANAAPNSTETKVKTRAVTIKGIKQTQVPTSTAKAQALSYKPMSDRYIIQLRKPSVLAHLQHQRKSTATKASHQEIVTRENWRQASSTQLYKTELLDQQQKFINKAKSLQPSIKVFKQFDLLINGIAVNATAEQIAIIKTLPEVSKVYPIHLYYANLDRSHEVIRSDVAWQKLGGRSSAGKNVKIAIIDTGIRNTNPLFSDDGLAPVDLSDNTYISAHPDFCRSAEGDAQFCNNKIVVARWIDPNVHGMDIYEGEYQSPLDFNGHGSHVAGIAAGAPIQVTIGDQAQNVSGVAPASQLMIYKSLYVDPFGNTVGTDTMLLEALETAVSDGADIINNSWGGIGQVPEESIFKEAIANAEASGIVVVNAAGNDLHAGGGYTINCPACIESGLAVANTTHGRFFGNEIEINGEAFMGYQGEQPTLTTDKALTLHAIDVVDYANSDICSADLSENAFNGGVILAEYRYNCTFEEIALNIKKAGGEVVILAPGGSFGMATYEPLLPIHFNELAIPILGVSRDTGIRLAELAYTNRNIAKISADIVRGIEPQYSDKLHPFSSTGPNRSAYILKPDIAAPGTNILSAYSPDVYMGGLPPVEFSKQKQRVSFDGDSHAEDTFAILTGTSMASPHVAGAAALVKQAHPDWNAKQIKSALTSTGNTQVFNGYDKATAFGIGAGRLDVELALDAALTFDKVSFTDNACIGQCRFTNQVKNMLAHEGQWDVEVFFEDHLATGKVSIEQLTLSEAGKEGDNLSFTLVVDTSRSAIGEWVFGQVIFKQNDDTKQHLPIAIFTSDTSDSGILNVSAEKSDTSDNALIHIKTQVRNVNLPENEQLTLKMAIPENANFITTSDSVVIAQGTTTAINYDASNGELVWQGKLAQGKMQLMPVAPWGNTTLASLGVEPIACSDGCQYFNTYIGFDFVYNGKTYQDLTISDNGFIVPGNMDFSFWSALFNQHLPQATPLNNIIAPLWSEFDLADAMNPDDVGGGELRVAIRVIDEKNHLFIEWLNVQQFVDEVEPDNNDKQYSFQLIIEENTDNIWFNYLDIPVLPSAATIGAENYDGRIGVLTYFDGEGSGLPIPISGEGYTLKLNYQPEGQVNIQYDISLNNFQNFAMTDSFTINEEMAASFDVLANDERQNNIVSYAELMTSVQQYHAYRNLPVTIAGSIDESTLEIVTMPVHGSATIGANGQLNYQPSVDFTGKDKLTYKVADEAGIFSAPTPVNIQINNINDVPKVNKIIANNASVGQKVTVTAEVTDVDGDPLTFDWEQTQGPIVAYTQAENKIAFTAPEIILSEKIGFMVKVSDGNAFSESKSVEIVVTNKNSKKGGAMLYFVLVLLALLALKLELNSRTKKQLKELN